MALIDLTKKPSTLVNGRKTYIVVAIAIGLGVLSGLDLIAIPPAFMTVLTMLGMGTLRHAIQKAEAATRDAAKAAEKMDTRTLKDT